MELLSSFPHLCCLDHGVVELLPSLPGEPGDLLVEDGPPLPPPAAGAHGGAHGGEGVAVGVVGGRVAGGGRGHGRR